jgi:type I restriction enzyme R subunit
MFLKNRRLEVADLYEEPLDRFGEDALERWFSVVRRKWAN